jgi:hypothetical protein
MLERLNNYRRERIASHEAGEADPSPVELCYPGEKDGHFQLPPETEEGGLVEPQYPSWFPREPLKDIPTKTPFKESISSTLYESNPVRHWEQRRRMRRISDYGKR